jgi:hypothetical protein
VAARRRCSRSAGPGDLLPLTEAIVDAIRTIEPHITPDELDDARTRFEPLVEALEVIRPGLKEDGEELAACLVRLQPPRGNPQKPDAREIERFRDALDWISAASWLVIAMRAAEAGYFLPSNLAAMVDFVDDAAFRARTAPKTRKGSASQGHHVAGACAALYFDLTRERPKELNYASTKIGACNDYAMLVKAAIDFFCSGVSWGFLAREAAHDWAKIIKNQ